MGNSCGSASCLPEKESTMDLKPISEMVQDVTHLDRLISIIEERLNAIATENNRAQQNTSTPEVGSSSMFDSCTNIGKDLVEKMLKRAERNRCVVCFKSGYNRETQKMVIEVLKGASPIQSLAAGVCVVGYLLDQIQQLSDNRDECVRLLRWLCALARRVKQLDHNVPAETEQLKQAVNFIFEGCVLCLTQIESHRLSRLFQASVDAKDLQTLESQIRNTYSDLTLGAVLHVVDSLPSYLPSIPGEDPKPVGRKVAKDEIIRLLKMDLTDNSKRAVVIYGLGGIGKTILATSVCSSLDLQGYKYCRLDMDENCSDGHIKQLQQQMLRDLFDRRNVVLNSSVQGQEQLTKSFKEASDRIFMFIDNVLAAKDLAKLLPTDLSYLPSGLRVLLTTRMLDQTLMLSRTDFERTSYKVDGLSSSDSKKLLCKIALGSANASIPQGIETIEVDEIVKMCGGIPLIIELVAPKFKECLTDTSGVESVKELLKESVMVGEGDMIRGVVDVVYNRLDERYKEAFLDIVCFFDKQLKREVIVAVGKDQLQVLLNAALIKVIDDDNENLYPLQWNSKVLVHDIIKARGRRLSQPDRILELDYLKDALQDTQKLQKIKGIGISGSTVTGEYEIKAESLNLMHSSLRVMSLPKSIKMNGICDRSFQNLKYLEIEGHLPMRPNQLENLAILKLADCENVGELPASLQLLSLTNSANLQTSFARLKSLIELNLSGCSNLTTLPESIENLTALQHLNLSHCTKLANLPPSFGQLNSLLFLLMEECSTLTSLPNSLGNLSSLHLLDLRKCEKLVALPQNFGNLSSLKLLDLSRCSNLESLPESFGQLTSLKILDMSNCDRLTSLPDNFEDLKSLEFLNIDGCKNLKTPHRDFRALTSLMNLWAMGIRLRVVGQRGSGHRS